MDIDEAPCECFTPQKIPTIHQRTKEGTLLCTGKPLRPGAIAVGGRYGVSCILCKEAMNKRLEEKDVKLQTEENSDKIPTDQENDQTEQ